MSCGSGWGQKSEKSSHRERRGRRAEDTERREPKSTAPSASLRASRNGCTTKQKGRASTAPTRFIGIVRWLLGVGAAL